MRRNILVISQDFPYPPNHGGRVDILNRIYALKELKFKIYLIATIKHEVPLEHKQYMESICERIYLIKRSSSPKCLLSILPYQIKSRDMLSRAIFNKLKDINYEFMIIEGHYVFNLAMQIVKRAPCKNIYLRIHNDEVRYFSNLAHSVNSMSKKIFYYLEAFKFYFYEKKVIKRKPITGFLHISFDEKIKYEAMFPNINHHLLPASVDITKIKKYKIKYCANVLFVGSLFMPNNIEGLAWYLNNIHDYFVINQSQYRLIVAGNTLGVTKNELERLFGDKLNIELHESPDDLGKYYDRSMLFINPMLSGAGVKLKTLNALCEGLPVVSTAVGNEGTGLIDGEHVLVASNIIEFREKIIDVISNEPLRKSLTEDGQSFIKKYYNQKYVLEKILSS